MTEKDFRNLPRDYDRTNEGYKRRCFANASTDFSFLTDTRVAIITQDTYQSIMDNLPSTVEVIHVRASIGHEIERRNKAQIIIVTPHKGLLLGYSHCLTCTEIVAEKNAIAEASVDEYGENCYQSVDGLAKVDTSGVLGFIDKMVASVRPKVELQKSQVVMALLQKANGCQVQTDPTTTFINFRGDGIKVDCDFQQDKALLTIYGNGSYKEVTITRVDDLADINFNY